MLDKDFVSRNLEKAKGACIYGVPIDALTKDELIACLASSIERERGKRDGSSDGSLPRYYRRF